MNPRIESLLAQGKTVLYAGMNIADRLAGEMASMLDRSYPQPVWRLVVNGEDMTDGVSSRLMNLTLTDNRGLEADTLDVTLTDHDGALSIPPKGATLEVYLGWHTSELVYKGMFIASEITHQGSPDTLTIRALSADLKESIKQKKERSFDQTTLGDIIQKIALEHQLTAKIHADLASSDIYHLDQNESDISLLTRLAEEFDAAAMIKDDILLFMPIYVHETVSGEPLPTMVITRVLGDNHSYTEDADSISGVRAQFYDVTKKDKVPVLVGSDEDSVREIRYVHRDQKNATDAAMAAYRRARRETAKLSYTLAHGDPLLIPQMPVMVLGIKDSIDATDWTLTNVVHNLDDGGYTCKIECERLLSAVDEITPPITVGEQEKQKSKTDDKTESSAAKNLKSKGGKTRRAAKKRQREKSAKK